MPGGVGGVTPRGVPLSRSIPNVTSKFKELNSPGRDPEDAIESVRVRQARTSGQQYRQRAYQYHGFRQVGTARSKRRRKPRNPHEVVGVELEPWNRAGRSRRLTNCARAIAGTRFLI
jgi:hypothetical protein